jgi:methylmalonyl-CoA/ethylmalonyl-CoA epimerase
MISLSHIAIATPDVQKLAQQLKILSLEIEGIHEVPTEKVTAAFLPVEISEHFRLELLEPTSDDSPLSKFLTKRPDGGMHHLCFEVSKLEVWAETLPKHGIIVLPPGIRKAARGRALFIHPKSMGGVLVELEEIGT